MKNNKQHQKLPGETYREEKENEGSAFMDSDRESAERDAAKIDKAISGESQKIDTVHPDDLQPDRNDEIMEQERRND